jgi:hypothetical protein
MEARVMITPVANNIEVKVSAVICTNGAEAASKVGTLRHETRVYLLLWHVSKQAEQKCTNSGKLRELYLKSLVKRFNNLIKVRPVRAKSQRKHIGILIPLKGDTPPLAMDRHYGRHQTRQ